MLTGTQLSPGGLALARASADSATPPTCNYDPNNPGNTTDPNLPLYDVPVSATDPSGTMAGLEPSADFCVSDPTGPSNGRLFVFFPGSFAVAEDYREILVQAAATGYHVIGLSYPNGGTNEANDTLSQQDLSGICGNNIGPANSTIDCWNEARLNRFNGTPEADGADWTDPYASSIGAPGAVGTGCAGVNSIEYRLQPLLTYLASSDPGSESSSWAPFMTGTNACGGTPTWSDMVLSGHSQGGGEAAYIGKLVSLASVISFDDPDDSTSTSSASENDASCAGSDATQQTVPAN